MKATAITKELPVGPGPQRKITTNAAELAQLADEAVERCAQNRRSGQRLKAHRWWCILRYHHKSQLARRLWKVVRGNKVYGVSTGYSPELRGNGNWRKLLAHKIAERQSAELSASVERILAGELTFLNESCRLAQPIDWKLKSHPELSHLWRFHLHYQEDLLDLIADDTHSAEQRLSAAWDLVKQWISGNSPSDPATRNDAWHAFCISRRLPVWSLVWQASPPPTELQPTVLQSLSTQAHYLEKNLELDLGGNHLLENARALAFAGSFFAGADGDRWLKKADQIFRQELPRQVLPSGEHFERSPMYHAQMLAGLLDVRDLAADFHAELASLCERYIDSMAKFLASIVHPDGQIPLLSDSAFGEAPSAQLLLARAGIDPSRESTAGPAQVGDYWTFRDGQNYLLLDAGSVAPEHLPAHGHSDLLNLEISCGEQRLITDTGVLNYADDAMRDYCRSTEAHNVLQVDGQQQCDVYSKFRMGRRGWPSPLQFGEIGGFSWAGATHNAYRHLGGIEVGRVVACRSGGPWLIIDWATGTGRHTIDNRLHFHPGVELEQLDDHRVIVQHAGQTGQLSALGRGSLSIEGGWYCPEFGRQIARPVLRWSAETELPLVTAWCWQPEGCEGDVRLEMKPQDNPAVCWTDHSGEVRLKPLDLLKSSSLRS